MKKHAADLMLLAGASGVTFGAWLCFEPAGWITGGALLVVAAVSRGRAEAFASYQERKGR